MIGGGGSSEDGAGAIFVVLVGLIIWGIVAFWPWPLLALPAAVGVGLTGSRSARASLRQCFRAGPDTGRDWFNRRTLLLSSFLTAAIYAVLSLLTLPSDALQWWLIPIAFSAAGFRFLQLRTENRRGSRLIQAIAKRAFELLTIASVVFLFYTVALVVLWAAPIQDIPVERIREFEKQVGEVNELVKAHNAELWVALTCLSVISVWQILDTVHAPRTETGHKTREAISTGLKWSSRLFTVLALTASLTLLATKADGPLKGYGVAIRDTKQIYSDFHKAVENHVGVLLQQELAKKTWAARPPNVIGAMQSSTQFILARQKYENAATQLRTIYEVERQPMADVPPSRIERTPPASSPVNDIRAQDDSHWTPNDVRSANADSSKLSDLTLKQSLGDSANPVDEATVETMSKLMSMAFEGGAPAVRKIAEQYPVFGQFLDVILSSFADSSYERSREAIVERIIKARCLNPRLDIAAKAKEEVAAVLLTLHFEWSSLNDDWNRKTEESLMLYKSRVQEGYEQVMSVAAITRDRKRVALIKQLSKFQEKYREAARIISSVDDQAHANAVLDATAPLIQLAQQWPALGEPRADQKEQLVKMARSARDTIPDLRNVMREVLARGEPAPTSYYLSSDRHAEATRAVMEMTFHPKPEAWEETPDDLLQAFVQYNMERVIEIVGLVPEGSPEAAELQLLFRDAYQKIRKGWEERKTDRRNRYQQAQEERAEVRRMEIEMRTRYESRMRIP